MKKNEKSKLKNLLFEKENGYKNLFAETKNSFKKLSYPEKGGNRKRMFKTKGCRYVDKLFQQLSIVFIFF